MQSVWVEEMYGDTSSLRLIPLHEYFTLRHGHSVKHRAFCLHSAEIDQKLQEIMKQTGYLKIDGQVRCARIQQRSQKDLDSSPL